MNVMLNRIKNIFILRVITLGYTLHFWMFCLKKQNNSKSNQPM